MPGPAVHLTTMKLTISSSRTDFPNYSALLNDNPEFAALGAMGPDLWYATTGLSAVNFIHNIGVTFLDLGASLRDARDDNSPLDQLQDLMARALNILGELELQIPIALEAVASFFMNAQFRPVLQDGDEFTEKYWSWGDLLHYRRTGRMASSLFHFSEGGSDAMKAYALGYITHIGTDIIGHPFVNNVVGGPFRTRAQFHHIMENHMDSYVWSRYESGPVTNSRLHERLPDAFNGAFKDFIDQAINEAYAGADTPNDDYDLDELLEHFRTFIELVTRFTHIPPPVPPGEHVLRALADLSEDVTSALSRIANRHRDFVREHLTGGSFSLSALWDAVKDFFKDIGQDLMDLVRLAGDLIKDLIELGVALATLPLEALLYSMELALYTSWRLLRSFAVHAGLLYPEPDETIPLWHTAILPTVASPLSTSTVLLDEMLKYTGLSALSVGYPQRELAQNDILDGFLTTFLALNSTSMGVPLSTFYFPEQEDPGTNGSNYPFARPEHFIEFFSAHTDEAVIRRWFDAVTPRDTDSVNDDTFDTGRLGNAVGFIQRLYGDPLNIPDFNLDGDRGYAYKCWEPVGRSGTNPLLSSFVNISYIDD